MTIVNSHPLMKSYLQLVVSEEETIIHFEDVTTHWQDFHIPVDGPTPVHLFIALTRLGYQKKKRDKVGREHEEGIWGDVTIFYVCIYNQLGLQSQYKFSINLTDIVTR